MATSLLSDIKTQLTPDMVQHLSSLLGESPVNTQKAVDEVLPTLLAGVMNFSSSGSGATQLVDLITHGDYGNVLNNLSGLLNEGNTAERMMSSGRNILSLVFAGKLPAVSELITTSSGIKNTSASSLLSLAAPVVLGVVARARTAQGLNAVGLTTLLLGQKEGIAELAPAGLASVLGTNLGAERPGTTTWMAPNEKTWATWEKRGERSAWPPWWALLLGVVALSVVYLLWGQGTEATLLRTSASPQIAKLALGSPTTRSTVTLPDGAVLSLRAGSFTSNLATFLGDATATVVPKTFVFDHVYFISGTPTLTPESEQTVKELSTILTAYPTTEVQLDGYSDSRGDIAGNTKLSLDQAEAVKAALIRRGIDAPRLTTAGYGQAHPRASNDTEEGRAKNRRLELVVVKR